MPNRTRSKKVGTHVIQHGGYRHVPAGSTKRPTQAPGLKAKRQPRSHAGDFHVALGKLKQALYQQDPKRIAAAERTIDHIVASWERER